VCLSNEISSDTIWRYFFNQHSDDVTLIQSVIGNNMSFTEIKRKLKCISICTGTNGSDISFDGGKKWYPLSTGIGYNSCEFYNGGVVFVGNKGAIDIVDFAELGKRFYSAFTTNKS
jgi:hypothetical protein